MGSTRSDVDAQALSQLLRPILRPYVQKLHDAINERLGVIQDMVINERRMRGLYTWAPAWRAREQRRRHGDAPWGRSSWGAGKARAAECYARGDVTIPNQVVVSPSPNPPKGDLHTRHPSGKSSSEEGRNRKDAGIVLGEEANRPSRTKDGTSKDGIPVAENRPRTKDGILKDEIKSTKDEIFRTKDEILKCQKSSFKAEGRNRKDEGRNIGRTNYWKDEILKDEGRNLEGRRTKSEGRRTKYWKDEILEGRNIEGRRTESRGTKDDIPGN
eukprot:gene12626-biopygen2219